MRGLFALAIGLAVLAAPRTAQARDPVTHMAFLLGGRLNTGALGDHYALGYALGGEAGYQLGLIGIDWSLLFNSFESARPENVAAELRMIEMGLALRGRVALSRGDVSTFALIRAGANIVRTSVPVPPDDKRDYIGPAGGIGLEFFIFDTYSITLDGRYGLFPAGPSGVTVLLSIGVGGR